MAKKIYIVYYSKSGNTRKLAETILESFSNFEADGVDIELMNAKELDIEALKSAEGYIIGTPNYFSAPSGYIKIFFDELYIHRATLKGRPVFYFITHGGSGDIRHMKVMCDWLELKIIGPPILVKGVNISSKNLSTIETNIQEMMKQI
jgi:multimeric flavodoxin WrbA